MPADRADDVKQDPRRDRPRRAHRPLRKRRVCKEGRRINVSLSVSPIRDHDGTIVGAAKIARDVTLQRRADEERQATVRRLGTLYAVGQAVAAELDRERVLQTITDAARDLSGAKFGAFFYNVADPEGGHYLLYTLSGAPRAAFERFGAPRNTAVFAPTFAGEGVVRVADIRKDPRYGHNRPHHGTPVGHLPVTSYLAVPVRAAPARCSAGCSSAIPNRVFDEEAERVVVALASQASIALENARLYEAEQRARAAAEQASQDKDEFLAMLGHELRNPLAAVRNALIASRLEPARAERALEIARHAAEQLTRLVDDLLDVARITQGRLADAPTPFAAPRVVERAVETTRRAIDERGVALTSRCPRRACASRATRRGSSRWSATCSTTPPSTRSAAAHRASRSSGTATRGDRVPTPASASRRSLLPRIFDCSSRPMQPLDRSRGGLGIGLTLVKRLVELHGGRVEAHSDGPATGAEFLVSPARRGGATHDPPVAGRRGAGAIGPASVRIWSSRTTPTPPRA